MGVSQNYGYLFGGPHNKDCSILGSILGSLILGNYHLVPSVIDEYVALSRALPRSMAWAFQLSR